MGQYAAMAGAASGGAVGRAVCRTQQRQLLVAPRRISHEKQKKNVARGSCWRCVRTSGLSRQLMAVARGWASLPLWKPSVA